MIFYNNTVKGKVMESKLLFKLPTITIKMPSTPVSDLIKKIKIHKKEIYNIIEAFFKKKLPTSIYKDFSELFWKSIKKEIPFQHLLLRLKDLYNEVDYSTKPADNSRALSRVKNIKKWLNPLKRRKNLTYLDVGCSEASITGVVAQALGLESGDIYGCDIYIEEIPESDVIFSRNTPTSLPYKDEEFTLVTAFQALHHFSDPEKMLSEIHRVLQPKGVFIIREHDVRNEAYGVYLDLIHALYMTVMGSEMTPEDFVAKYESFYHSKEQWSKKYIVPTGFRFAGIIKTNDRFNSYYARYYKI